MRTVPLLVLMFAVVAVAACSSKDEKAIYNVVSRRFPGQEVVNISQPQIYRSRSNARLACVTFNLRDQWGDDSPLQRIIAWYIPSNGTWHTDNAIVIGDDEERQCVRYIEKDKMGAVAPVAETRQLTPAEKRDEMLRWLPGGYGAAIPANTSSDGAGAAQAEIPVANDFNAARRTVPDSGVAPSEDSARGASAQSKAEVRVSDAADEASRARVAADSACREQRGQAEMRASLDRDDPAGAIARARASITCSSDPVH